MVTEPTKNTILIVDDENANLKYLSFILGEDYTIYTATSGENAIKKAKELKPDLILLDIIMPDMDGYEVISTLKMTEGVQNIPIIFISGLDSAEDEEKGLSMDAVDYITKPFKAPIVKLRVRNQIQIINQLRTIENVSMLDQLTGIPNRRCFDKHLNIEWKQAIREQTVISFLMMDLDRFKNLNDTYGHQQGDVVLKTVAGIFQNSLRRPCDFTARWGGEEFVVLLPNTSLEGAIGVAEHIRSSVEDLKIFTEDGVSIKTTISIGVTACNPKSNFPLEKFISNADKALYMAKEAGRNKVIEFV